MRRAAWEEMFHRFDPLDPPRDPAWRAPRPHSPIDRILRPLDRSFGDPRILLAGTVGTGKSTELLRIRDARASKDLAIVLDLYRHFNAIRDAEALQRIEAWEVVFHAGVAVLAAARGELAYPVPQEHIHALERAWEAMAEATGTPRATELDLGKLASEMMAAGAVLLPLAGLTPVSAVVAAAGVGTARAVAAAVRRIVPVGVSKQRLEDQDDRTQSLLGAVNVIIGYVQQHLRRVLLIIDGLDRIREEDRALDLFLHSELLGQLACRTVVCAPFALRSAPSAAAVRRFDRVVLANEPLIDKLHPTEPGPGVDFFCDVLRRRTVDFGDPPPIPEPLVRKLAYFSGGRARDFVKLVRSVAELSWDADAAQATPEVIDAVIDQARRDRELGLDTGHLSVLRKVVDDPARRLPEGPIARKLLDWGHLLPYPNESEWYYPHPLLTLHLLR
jgi:hypothetical protein